MGRQSSTLQGQHARSLFIGKPVAYKSSMARLGILRGGDLRCLSGTFMVVVFFCCIFMLSLQPSRYPTKLSMVDLPKDEVVRAQSIPELLPSHSAKGSGKEGKKSGGKGEPKNKSDKKAIKAKWIKDELPKKLHVGHVRNNTKMMLKLERSQLVEGSPDSSNKTGTDEKISEPPLLAQNESQPMQETADRTESSLLKVETGAPPVHTLPLRPHTSFSNLSQVPVHTFVSPFIESRFKAKKKEKKIITWYAAGEGLELSRLRDAMKKCPEPQCKLVYPLSEDQIADAVIFEDVDRKEAPPLRKHQDQVFVLRSMSPPISAHDAHWNLAWKTLFNWTWSYRNDSDIWQPLGLLKKAKKVKPLDYFHFLARTKKYAVAWIPQTCPQDTTPTQSRRDEFIGELSKHVHVTEFGPCSKLPCDVSSSSCSDNLTKKFFFLLAAEDDLCTDHVTEVFYRAWRENTHVLPVVRGGADYAAYFPEGTYIDTDWFDNAKKLAEFMAELVASRKVYAQLLWRKAHWVKSSKRQDEVSMCKLCQKLYSLSSNRKWYSNIQHWNKRNFCKDPKPF